MTSYRPKSTLEQWRIFQAVVDYGGYAKAGEVLNKSQSSLNHAMSKLQHTLGVQLLHVVGRKAVLTETGEVMLRRSRILTHNIEELEQLADNISSGWEPEITLACEIIHPKDKLYCALNEFYPLSRGTRVKMTDEVLTGTKERILEQTADLVICGIPPKGHTGDELTIVSMVCYCGSQHPLASSKQVELADLENELQIVISDTGNTPEEGSGWLKAEQRWTVSNFYQALDILKRNRGFCWIPTHLAKASVASGEIVEVPLNTAKERSIHTRLTTPNPAKLGPAAKLLKKLILEQYK